MTHEEESFCFADPRLLFVLGEVIFQVRVLTILQKDIQVVSIPIITQKTHNERRLQILQILNLIFQLFLQPRIDLANVDLLGCHLLPIFCVEAVVDLAWLALTQENALADFEIADILPILLLHRIFIYSATDTFLKRAYLSIQIYSNSSSNLSY